MAKGSSPGSSPGQISETDGSAGPVLTQEIAECILRVGTSVKTELINIMTGVATLRAGVATDKDISLSVGDRLWLRKSSIHCI